MFREAASPFGVHGAVRTCEVFLHHAANIPCCAEVLLDIETSLDQVLTASEYCTHTRLTLCRHSVSYDIAIFLWSKSLRCPLR